MYAWYFYAVYPKRVHMQIEKIVQQTLLCSSSVSNIGLSFGTRIQAFHAFTFVRNDEKTSVKVYRSAVCKPLTAAIAKLIFLINPIKSC